MHYHSFFYAVLFLAVPARCFVAKPTLRAGFSVSTPARACRAPMKVFASVKWYGDTPYGEAPTSAELAFASSYLDKTGEPRGFCNWIVPVGLAPTLFSVPFFVLSPSASSPTLLHLPLISFLAGSEDVLRALLTVQGKVMVGRYPHGTPLGSKTGRPTKDESIQHLRALARAGINTYVMLQEVREHGILHPRRTSHNALHLM